MEQKNLNLMAVISKLKNTSEEIKILNLDNYKRKKRHRNLHSKIIKK